MKDPEKKKSGPYRYLKSLLYLLLLITIIYAGLRLWNSGNNNEEKQYQFYRKIADSLYQHKSYKDALNFYRSALSYRPDDRYALEQIKAVQINMDITFFNTFGGAQKDEGIGVALTNDGGYLLVGNTESWGNGNSKGWLIKTDAHGLLERRQTLGNGDENFLHALTPTLDGYFVAVGTSKQNDKNYVWMVKINQEGRSLWEKEWGSDTVSVSGLAIAENKDSTLIISGHIQVSDTSATDAWLGHFDDEGNLIDNFKYGKQGADAAMSVVFLNDSTFAFAGYTLEFPETHTDGWLVLCDLQGNILHQTKTGGKSNDVFTALTKLNDGRMIAAGHSQSYGNGSLDLWMVQFDAEGKEQWNKVISGEGNDGAKSIIAMQDGSFAIAGYTTSFGHGGKDIWLLKLHRNGALDWKKELGDIEDDLVNMLLMAPDGGFVLSGFVTQKNNTELCVIKTNPGGELSEMK